MTEETQGEAQPLAEDTMPAPQTQAEATPAQEADTGDDPAADATTEGEDGEQPPKPKVTARERINELTKARREAERRADEAEERYRRLAAGQSQQPTPEPWSEEPNPDDYEHGVQDIAYIEDRAVYRATKALEERMSRERASQSIQTKLTAFEAKAEELYPEGDPEGLEAFRSNPRVHRDAQEIVMESDIGPTLADYLGSRPRELARISALPPHKQVREITLIEQRLTGQKPAAPTPKTATSAPEPPPQARGSGGRFQAAPDTDDFAAFEKQYGNT